MMARQPYQSLRLYALAAAAVFLLGLGACSEDAAYRQTDCLRWNTYEFFEAARASDVRRCLRDGVNPNARNAENRTPMHWAVITQADPNIVRLLLEAGASPGGFDRDGRQPLHYLAYSAGLEGSRRALQAAEMLVRAGANVQAYTDPDFERPLHIAAEGQNPHMIRLLLAAGADPNVRRRFGSTPLHHVASRHPLCTTSRAEGCPFCNGMSAERCAVTLIRADDIASVMRMLLDAGGDPNARNNEGRTPLHEAIYEQLCDRVWLNFPPEDGCGWWVAADSRSAIIELLLDAGADPTIRTRDGRTALDLVETNPAIRNGPAHERLRSWSRTRP